MSSSFWGFLRSLHKWVAVAITVPVIFVIVTGIILQMRKPIDYIQPNLHYGEARYQPTASLESILESVKAVPEMQVSGWKDIKLFDLRPKAGIVKIRTFAEMEAQVDTKSAKVLNVQQRWNDIITLLHDGSTWGMRTSLFVLSGAFSLLLAISGLFLMYQWVKESISVARKRDANLAEKQSVVEGPKPPRRFDLMKFCRKYHLYLSFLIIFPWVVTTASGLLLQLRYEIPWVMPERKQGVSKIPKIEFIESFEQVKKLKGLEITEWKDVWRIYVYPNDGIVSVRTKKNRWEAQFDSVTGELLDLSTRRTDILEDIHEGKWINANWWFFLPAHLLSILLWLSGVYLWIRTFWPRRR